MKPLTSYLTEGVMDAGFDVDDVTLLQDIIRADVPVKEMSNNLRTWLNANSSTIKTRYKANGNYICIRNGNGLVEFHDKASEDIYSMWGISSFNMSVWACQDAYDSPSDVEREYSRSDWEVWKVRDNNTWKRIIKYLR